MKIVQPVEVVILTIFGILASVSWWHYRIAELSLMIVIIGLLFTLLMVCYRTISYIIAFLTEVAPSFAVVREFLKKFGS
jgi:hypothetical protein